MKDNDIVMWQLHTISADVERLNTQWSVEPRRRPRLHKHTIVELWRQLQLHARFITVDYLQFCRSVVMCVVTSRRHSIHSAVLNCHGVVDIMTLAHRHWLQQHSQQPMLSLSSSSSSRPVSRRISRRLKKNCGLAAVDVAKPPAAGQNKIRLSRRFCHRLSRDHNDVKVCIATLLLPICALKSPVTTFKSYDGAASMTAFNWS